MNIYFENIVLHGSLPVETKEWMKVNELSELSAVGCEVKVICNSSNGFIIKWNLFFKIR